MYIFPFSYTLKITKVLIQLLGAFCGIFFFNMNIKCPSI